MSSAKRGIAKRSAGFSLIEIMVAVGLIGILVAAATTLFTTFGKRLTQLRLEQTMRSEVHSIFESFASSSSCDRQIATGWRSLPTLPDQPHIDLAKIEMHGEMLTIGADGAALPWMPRGRILNVSLDFFGAPFPNQRVLRAKLSVDFRIDPLTGDTNGSLNVPVHHAERSIFFALDPSSRLASCLDAVTDNALEWSERFCLRYGATMKSDGQCDLQSSPIVKTATCSALGLKSSGGLCEI